MLVSLLFISSKATNITIFIVNRTKVVNADLESTVADFVRADLGRNPHRYTIQFRGRTLDQAAILEDEGVRAGSQLTAVWTEDLSGIQSISETLTDYARGRLLRKLRKMRETEHCAVFVGDTPWFVIKKQCLLGGIRYVSLWTFAQRAGLVRKDRVELRLRDEDVWQSSNHTNESN